MHSRPWLALTLTAAVLAGGCKQWKAPEKIDELEKRVDELSEVVSEMKGKPVGKKKLPPKPKKTDDEEGEAEAEDGEDAGAEAKATEGEEGGGEDAPRAGFGKADAKKVAHKDDAPPKGDEPAKKDAPARGDEAAKKDAPAKGDEAAKKDAPAKGDEAPAARLAADAKPARSDDAIAAAAHKALASPAHWSYDGDTGPEHWGELEDGYSACANGQLQSPIDVVPPGGKRASDIVFVYQPTKARVVDTGHTLQVQFDAGNTIFIDGHRYDLVQMHVHTPSEHTIAGERYPLELHLVHKDVDGKLAVVAVLYDEGQASAFMDNVYRHWPSKQNDERPLGKLDVAALLPDSRGVFRYEGSLTTPPCTEGVVWNVMRRTRTDSAAHLALFKKHYAANARPVQKLNGRDLK